MSKYDAVYFVGDNQVINRVRVGSSKTRNRDAFLGHVWSRNFLSGEEHIKCLRIT